MLALPNTLHIGVLAGEQPTGERPPSEDGETQRVGHRHQLALHRALDQAVLDLDRRERCPAALARERVALGDRPRRDVGDPNVQDLPRTDLIVERPHQLCDGRDGVPEMDPEQVHVVGPQPTKALIQRLHQALAVVAERIDVTRADRRCVLGRQHEAVAVCREQLADDLLAATPRVVVGGVDEVPADLAVGVEDAPALLQRRAPVDGAERHRAQARLRDTKAAATELQIPHCAAC